MLSFEYMTMAANQTLDETNADAENEDTECEESQFSDLSEQPAYQGWAVAADAAGRSAPESGAGKHDMIRGLRELREMVEKTQETARSWTKGQTFLCHAEQQLRRLAAKRSKKLPHHTLKCSELRQKSREAEEALDMRFVELHDRIGALQVEVRSRRPENRTQAPEMTNEQLKRVNDIMLCSGHRLLRAKDDALAAKDAQIKELRRGMLQMRLSARVVDNTEALNEQRQQIKSLSGHLVMFQQAAERYKRESEKCAEDVSAIKQLYYKEKKKNRNPAEAAKGRGFKQ